MTGLTKLETVAQTYLELRATEERLKQLRAQLQGEVESLTEEQRQAWKQIEVVLFSS